MEKLLTLKLLWLVFAGVVGALILLSGPPPLMVLTTLGVFEAVSHEGLKGGDKRVCTVRG